MAKRKGSEMSSVVIGYVLLKAPHMFPVVGMRTKEQVEQNAKALELSLTKEEM
jgi:aryl-alcohol dehydrogenase-like predicted oxidoreductase